MDRPGAQGHGGGTKSCTQSSASAHEVQSWPGLQSMDWLHLSQRAEVGPQHWLCGRVPAGLIGEMLRATQRRGWESSSTAIPQFPAVL